VKILFHDLIFKNFIKTFSNTEKLRLKQNNKSFSQITFKGNPSYLNYLPNIIK